SSFLSSGFGGGAAASGGPASTIFPFGPLFGGIGAGFSEAAGPAGGFPLGAGCASTFFARIIKPRPTARMSAIACTIHMRFLRACGRFLFFFVVDSVELKCVVLCVRCVSGPRHRNTGVNLRTHSRGHLLRHWCQADDASFLRYFGRISQRNLTSFI